MIVLDASAAVEMLVGIGAWSKVFDRVDQPGESLHAPHHIDLEIVSTLRTLLRAREISPARADQALAHLGDLTITRWPYHALIPRIWQLRANATAYDAAYLALAEILEAPVVTCDRKLSAVIGHRATVEVI